MTLPLGIINLQMWGTWARQPLLHVSGCSSCPSVSGCGMAATEKNVWVQTSSATPAASDTQNLAWAADETARVRAAPRVRGKRKKGLGAGTIALTCTKVCQGLCGDASTHAEAAHAISAACVLSTCVRRNLPVYERIRACGGACVTRSPRQNKRALTHTEPKQKASHKAHEQQQQQQHIAAQNRENTFFSHSALHVLRQHEGLPLHCSRQRRRKWTRARDTWRRRDDCI